MAAAVLKLHGILIKLADIGAAISNITAMLIDPAAICCVSLPTTSTFW